MNYVKKKGICKLQVLIMAVVLVVSTMLPHITVSAAPKEVAQAAIGIDVSKYQGKIDWNQVAASGVQFAMIRVGYRTQTSGLLTEDPYARYNLQEATRVGIKVGAYFFSTAVTDAEVVEEATWTANLLDKYKITYPVAYDCEGYSKMTSRQFPLDKATRTYLAVRFLDTIASRGYTPMFYSSRNEMNASAQWDMSVLNKYKVWVAWYPSEPFPITTACTYQGVHAMWQYTSKAIIAGINGYVDMNVAYFNYDSIASAKNTSGAVPVSAPMPVSNAAPADNATSANVSYTDVLEVVTPNTTLNLRTVPSVASADTIVVKIKAGDMIYRTGIGSDGWSKVILNGQTLYACSMYLTKVA